MKRCCTCKAEKGRDQFSKFQFETKYGKCRECLRKYYQNNINKIKEYYKINADDRKRYCKTYRTINKQKINELKKEYQKERLKNDPIFRLRCKVSTSVNTMLKSLKSSKSGCSVLDCLCYTIEDLKIHDSTQGYRHPRGGGGIAK